MSVILFDFLLRVFQSSPIIVFSFIFCFLGFIFVNYCFRELHPTVKYFAIKQKRALDEADYVFRLGMMINIHEGAFIHISVWT